VVQESRQIGREKVHGERNGAAVGATVAATVIGDDIRRSPEMLDDG
jgi:hypothetical protein